jgi:hypothetical protein
MESKDSNIITNELKKMWPFDLISEYNEKNLRYVRGKINKIEVIRDDDKYLMMTMDTIIPLLYPAYIIYDNNNKRYNIHDVLMPFLIDLLIENDLKGINSTMCNINKNGKQTLRLRKGIYRKEYDLIKGPILKDSIGYKGKKYLGYISCNKLSGIAIKKPSDIGCIMPKLYIFFHGKVFHKIHLVHIKTDYESFILKYKRFLPKENIYERFIWYSFSNDIFFLDDLSSKLGYIDVSKKIKLSQIDDILDKYMNIDEANQSIELIETSIFRKTKTGSLIQTIPNHPTSHSLKIPEDIPKNMQSILKEMFMDEFLEDEMRLIIVKWFRKFNITIKI